MQHWQWSRAVLLRALIETRDAASIRALAGNGGSKLIQPKHFAHKLNRAAVAEAAAAGQPEVKCAAVVR